jgi:hypothetical protein
MRVFTDWMDRKYLSQVLDIERDTAPKNGSWDENDFLRELAGPNVMGKIALGVEDSVLGFIIYEVESYKFHILHMGLNPTLTVADTYVVGHALLKDLTDKVQYGKRSAITFGCREGSVILQKMLSAEGFKAFKVLREHFIDTGEDSYLFKYERVTAPLTIECD